MNDLLKSNSLDNTQHVLYLILFTFNDSQNLKSTFEIVPRKECKQNEKMKD